MKIISTYTIPIERKKSIFKRLATFLKKENTLFWLEEIATTLVFVMTIVTIFLIYIIV